MTGTEREPGGLVPRIWTPISVFEELERTLNSARPGFTLSGTNKIGVEQAPPRHMRVD